MDSDPRSLLQSVHTRLADHFQAQEAETLWNLSIDQTYERSFSTVSFLRAETSAGVRQLVMKKVAHHPINLNITRKQNQAVVEYEILQDLYPKFQEVEGCAVPRPILVIPELEILVMELVQGYSLSEKLDNARYLAKRSEFEHLKRYYYLCGRWLHYFQTFTGIEASGIDSFDDMLKRFEHRLLLIEQTTNSTCPSELRNHTLRLIEKHLLLLDGTPVLIAGRHGDFGHWNVIVGQEGVTVIDFLGYRKEPVVYDPLKILLSFETWKKNPLFNKQRLHHVELAFIEGFGHHIDAPFPVKLICTIYHRVCDILACITNPGQHLQDRIMKKRLLRHNFNILLEYYNMFK